MNEQEFWSLIAAINTKKLRSCDEKAAILPLERRLSECPESELFAFEEHLSQKLYALDAAEYADNAGESGDSGDAFLYARCFVVAAGRDQYEATKRDPTLMPKSIDEWCEPLLYAHRSAWSKLTGKDQGAWPFSPSVSYESFSNRSAWPHLSR